MTIKFWLCIVIILLVPQRLYAATDQEGIPPPQLPNIDYLHSTLTSPPISKVLLGKVEVEFERTTLGEIQKYANAGVIYHRGDAGGSENWICYTVSFVGQPERIWFSSGELGGPERAVGNFYAVIGDETTKPSPSCPELPAQLRPVSLGNSLWPDLNSALEKVE